MASLRSRLALVRPMMSGPDLSGVPANEAVPIGTLPGAARFVDISQVGLKFKTAAGTFEALRDVNLQIRRGECIAVIGHSGCGKSTLLNLLAGLLMPSTGGLVCDGREIAGPGPDRAVVFQNHSLLPWLTCAQNVHLAVERVFGATEKKAQLRERTAAQ